ncbi:MAG: MFS transporter, partial [Planctomycetes bacterium]|nr:MFS transporter [Planctomycetota bacterium]
MSEPVLAQSPDNQSKSGAFCSLKHTNYRYYFFAQLLSLTGSWTQTTALMWLAYSAEQQSVWPSLIAALQVLPGCFLGPLGGRLADQYPRKKLILITQVLFLLQSLGLFFAVFLGFTSPYILLCFSLLWGLINAIDLPARLTFLVEMVSMRDLFNAVALNSLQFNLARLSGPAIGALLLANYGPEACFLLNTFSYLILILALGLMNQATMFQEPSQRNNASLFDG